MKVNDYHLILIFCAIGCLFQFYKVTKQFLEFRVRSEIVFDYPRTVELPDIDIMIPMALAINMTELFVRYPKKMMSVCIFLMNQRNESFTITTDNYEKLCPILHEAPIIVSRHMTNFVTSQDIEQLTMNVYHNINQFILTETETETELLSRNMCNITQFYSSTAVYLRLGCRNQSKPFTIDVRKYLVSGSEFAVLVHSLGNNFGFRFASPSSPCEINPSRYFTITKATKGLIVTSVRYKKTISISMKFPYETSCQNYDKSAALWNCILSRATNKQENSYLPEEVLISYGKYPGNLMFRANDEMNICSDVMDKPECENIAYETEGNTLPEQMNVNTGYIYLQPPLDPVVYFKTYPAFPLSDFIIYVGSIFGIWFGISISERLSSGIKYLKILRKKRNEKPTKRPSYFSHNSIYYMDK